MTDYSQNTDFSAKDALPSGDSGKVIKGSDFDSEFSEIQTAIATKANKISGGVTDDLITQDANGDLQASGYNILDEDDLSSDAADALPTQQSVKAYIDGTTDVTGTDGYQQFGNGLILQWGYAAVSANSTAITFPLEFPTACINVSITARQDSDSGGLSSAPAVGGTSLATTGFTASTVSTWTGIYWTAVGN